MDEIAVITSSKEASGVHLIDCKTGTNTGGNFKNCIAEPNGMCFIGGATSYSGIGSVDHIAVAQSKKPIINIYSWGKPQVTNITCGFCTLLYFYNFRPACNVIFKK